MEPVDPIKKIVANQLFLDRLPRETRDAFLICIELPFFLKTDWYLAGGTALALQIGHRQSVDLDFFTTQSKFQELAVERELLATNYWRTNYREEGTIYGTLKDAKVSFIAYPFFKPSAQKLLCGTISILLPEDVAVMKIISMSQRGRKRDFIDLYWYCLNREPLIAIIQRVIKQYPGQENNLSHIIKSLAYFADAEADPMPKLFFEVDWKSVKKFFQQEAVRLAQEFLGAK